MANLPMPTEKPRLVQGTTPFPNQLLDRVMPKLRDTEWRLLSINRIQPKKRVFPFTGFMRCGSCGCLITAERKVKRYKETRRTVEYEYYHCTHRKGDCGERSVTTETLRIERLPSEAVRRIEIRHSLRSHPRQAGNHAASDADQASCVRTSENASIYGWSGDVSPRRSH